MSSDAPKATVNDLRKGSVDELMVLPIKKPDWVFVATFWERQAARELFIAFEELNFNTPETCDNYNVAVLSWPKQSGMIWFVGSFPRTYFAVFQKMALERDLKVRSGVPVIPNFDTGNLDAQFPMPDTDNVFCLEHKNGTVMVMISPKGFPDLEPDDKPRS